MNIIYKSIHSFILIEIKKFFFKKKQVNKITFKILLF